MICIIFFVLYFIHVFVGVFGFVSMSLVILSNVSRTYVEVNNS